MKKIAWLAVLLVFPSIAMANPTVLPKRLPATVIVIGAAFVVEVMLTALVLVFCGLVSMHLIWALLLGNAVLYAAAFLPLLSATGNVPVSEIIIIVIEALFIKMLSRFEVFQTSDFRRLPWIGAFLAAAVGNMASMLVGFALN
ncbi:MAG: hypothetical protein ACYTAN_10875 [Planctomycetota bacterium]|jgi:hypothetical protein